MTPMSAQTLLVAGVLWMFGSVALGLLISSMIALADRRTAAVVATVGRAAPSTADLAEVQPALVAA
jgi:hypothetical protein